MKLNLGDGMTLPIEAVTQTFAILAKRGVGKTYTASVMAEEMLKHQQQIVAIDPVGAMWGLRSDYPVVVLGGEHADVPLEEHAGEVIARAIIENRFPAVLDLSLFRKGQMIRFMTAFAETLYRLNREPLHLFIDEADAFAPQGRSGFGVEENRMLGAMEDIVRRGRKRGIGCTLITQRPAVLNKNVLTQCEVLVAMRLVHPKDISAVMEWVNVQADPGKAGTMKAALPSLLVGEAWFWSPGWLDVFKRVRVRKRETFDSSATPKPGEVQRQPKKLAQIDLNALGEEIKATVEKAKADDPKALRAKIAELEKRYKNSEQTFIQNREPKIVEKIVEVPVLKNGQLEKALKVGEQIQLAADKLASAANALTAEISRASAAKVAAKPAAVVRPAPARPTVTPTVTRREPAAAEGTTSRSQQRILDSLAWLAALGLSPANKTQVALLADASPTSGGYFKNLGSLRTAGLIDYPQPSMVALTGAGAKAANPTAVPQTSEQLHEQICRRLSGSQAAILRHLISIHPVDISKDALAEAVGVSSTSGGYFNNLGRLRSLGLIEYPAPGLAVAAGLLFIGGDA